MNIYKWFKIFNLGTFEELELVSKTYSLELEGIGLKDFLVTKANLTSLTYEGVFLPLDLNDKNPFEFESLAVYVDDNQDVFLGLLQPEET